jgi:hypothetical protein
MPDVGGTGGRRPGIPPGQRLSSVFKKCTSSLIEGAKTTLQVLAVQAARRGMSGSGLPLADRHYVGNIGCCNVALSAFVGQSSPVVYRGPSLTTQPGTLPAGQHIAGSEADQKGQPLVPAEPPARGEGFRSLVAAGGWFTAADGKWPDWPVDPALAPGSGLSLLRVSHAPQIAAFLFRFGSESSSGQTQRIRTRITQPGTIHTDQHNGDTEADHEGIRQCEYQMHDSDLCASRSP